MWGPWENKKVIYLNHYDRVQCNITVALHYCTAKQLYIKLIFLAWKQALHLEGSQEVTQEPHVKGDVNARNGERKESLQQSLTNFHFHPGNCKVLKLSPETRNHNVSFFLRRQTFHVPTWIKTSTLWFCFHFVWELTNTTDAVRLIILYSVHVEQLHNN